jgi:hypothetical protein
MKLKPQFILPFLVLALLVAILSGLIRIGWQLSLTQAAGEHGALMVGSFLSSVIFLERAVTFKNKLVLLLPLMNAASAVAFLTGYPLVGQWMLLAGSLGFCVMCLYFVYHYKEKYYYLFFAGAFSLALGTWLLIRFQFYPRIVPWWMGYLLFTIVAERLELSRFLNITKQQNALLWLALAIVFAGLIIPFHLHGDIVFATGTILTAAWLLNYDMAFKSIRRAGQHRYSAVLLIVGYVWLIVTAVFLFMGNVNPFWYDATLHSFFVGFVFSMIFSHAPIIFPAVLKLPVKLYRPILYVWFILLQLSLVARVLFDAMLWVEGRRIAGLINGLTILIFFITIAAIIASELRTRKRLREA